MPAREREGRPAFALGVIGIVVDIVRSSWSPTLLVGRPHLLLDSSTLVL
jgi:hypothetical protein